MYFLDFFKEDICMLISKIAWYKYMHRNMKIVPFTLVKWNNWHFAKLHKSVFVFTDNIQTKTIRAILFMACVLTHTKLWKILFKSFRIENRSYKTICADVANILWMRLLLEICYYNCEVNFFSLFQTIFGVDKRGFVGK